jgi:hypothetical protein
MWRRKCDSSFGQRHRLCFPLHTPRGGQMAAKSSGSASAGYLSHIPVYSGINFRSFVLNCGQVRPWLDYLQVAHGRSLGHGRPRRLPGESPGVKAIDHDPNLPWPFPASRRPCSRFRKTNFRNWSVMGCGFWSCSEGRGLCERYGGYF